MTTVAAKIDPIEPGSLLRMMQAIELGAGRLDAALSAGISRARFDAACADAAFVVELEAAEAKARVRAIAEATRAAAQGDRRSAAWLRSRLPHEVPEADQADPRPLTKKQKAFADAWCGNHTDAARAAGYKGNRSTLSSLGARLFQDPRVQRVIEQRRSRGELDGADPVEDGVAPVAEIRRGPSLPAGDARAKYEAIASDTTIAMGHRMRAIERIEQIERRDRGSEDAAAREARLLAKVQAGLREKRAREREARRERAEEGGS